jgi:hypothetical protein
LGREAKWCTKVDSFDRADVEIYHSGLICVGKKTDEENLGVFYILVRHLDWRIVLLIDVCDCMARTEVTERVWLCKMVLKACLGEVVLQLVQLGGYLKR